MTKDSKVFYQILREFLTVYLPKQKAASQNTIRSYKTALNMYLDYSCQKMKIKLDCFDFSLASRELLEGFLLFLEDEHHCSITSRNQRLAAIRRFFRFASEKDSIFVSSYHEMSLIPVKKVPEHEIEFFSEKALEAILAIPDTSTIKGIRDLVFMILLYDSAARIQEILDLKLQDLHIKDNERYVLLTGKGGKTRLVPLMQKTVDHLNKYIELFHNGSSDTEFLFYVIRKGDLNQMSQDNVSKFIKKYGEIARNKCPEVPEHLYVHMFRHSRAMHLYRNGMPMPLLSEWLGHTQMETTIKYYANADVKMKQDAVEKATSDFNPIIRSAVDFKFDNDDVVLKRLYGLM